MKYFFILILFFCIDISGLSQTIDSASIVITYRLKFLPDSNSPKKRKTDIDQLCIGNKISQFYSYIEYRSDSMLQSDLSKGTVTLQEISSNPNLREKYPRPGPLSRYQLYINYPENKTTTTDFIFGGQYFFEEQNEVPDWTILSDTTQFLGTNCQKALTTFRGRSYIAWFAPDIPLSAGPYKFRGLPGLIVRVEDTKSNFVYECIGIEYLLQKRPIVFNGSSFTKVTRTEYRKLVKAGFDNPYEVLINANRGHITMSEEGAAKIRREMQQPLPYNPIELE